MFLAEIEGGPGKFDLMVSFFNFEPVKFRLEGSYYGAEFALARIVLLQAKDSLRKNFVVGGLLGDGRDGCEIFIADYSLNGNRGMMTILRRHYDGDSYCRLINLMGGNFKLLTAIERLEELVELRKK